MEDASSSNGAVDVDSRITPLFPFTVAWFDALRRPYVRTAFFPLLPATKYGDQSAKKEKNGP